MTSQTKLWALSAGALALSLALAGCGGGGSSSSAPASTTTPPPVVAEDPAPSTEQQRFDARLAVRDAEKARDEAVTAVGASVTAATSAMGDASMYATNADDAADRAAAARTNAEKASGAATAADGHSTDASGAKGDADDAQTDLTDAITAYMMAIDGQDIETADGATAIKEAADTLLAAANMAKYDAADAQKAAEDARDDAMEYAGKAEMYEGDHVVGLLRMANADHIDTAADPEANSDETEAELITKHMAAHVEAVNMAIGAQATDATGDTSSNAESETSATAAWPHSATVSAADATEATERDGAFSLTVTIDGTAIETMADADDTMEGDQPNFGPLQGGGLGDFAHGLDMSSDGTRIIVFTDKEQASEPMDARTISYTNEPVPGHAGVTPTAAPTTAGQDGEGDFAGTYDPDGDGPLPMLTGTFDCVDPTTCRVTRTGTGSGGEHVADQTKVTSISGYTFSGTGTVARMLSMEDSSYLVFGVWLTETAAQAPSTVATYAFGAFADGATAGPVANDMMGSATYKGDAAGVHSTDDGVDFFSAKATLEADFGAGDAAGKITGSIHDIVSGGRSVDHDIILRLSDPGAADPEDNITTAGAFSGRARMGDSTGQDQSGENLYPMNGTWSGNFYNGAQNDTTTTVNEADTTHPGSVAGTFGVTNEDMDESFVGAFGAHIEEEE